MLEGQGHRLIFKVIESVLFFGYEYTLRGDVHILKFYGAALNEQTTITQFIGCLSSASGRRDLEQRTL